MLKGFWNYSEPVLVVPVSYEVTGTEETPLSWQNSHVGQRRQGLHVVTVPTSERPTQESFIIDNEHGDGYYKIFEKRGSPGAGHKSVSGPKDIHILPDEEIITRYDHEAIKAENELHDEFCEKADPETWEKLKSLKQGASNVRQFGLDKDGKPKTSL